MKFKSQIWLSLVLLAIGYSLIFLDAGIVSSILFVSVILLAIYEIINVIYKMKFKEVKKDA